MILTAVTADQKKETTKLFCDPLLKDLEHIETDGHPQRLFLRFIILNKLISSTMEQIK